MLRIRNTDVICKGPTAGACDDRPALSNQTVPQVIYDNSEKSRRKKICSSKIFSKKNDSSCLKESRDKKGPYKEHWSESEEALAMKLDDYRNEYYEASAKASEVARQLSFAGIALVWIFKEENAGPLSVPESLVWAALYFAGSLALDLLHATTRTAVWGAFQYYHERKGTDEKEELDTPAYFNWISLICFWGKLISLLAGYVFVLYFVYSSAAA